MSEESPVSIDISLDATQAVTELAQGSRGWMDTLRLALFGKRVDKVIAHGKRIQAQADFDAERIRQGDAFLDEQGRMVYLPSASQSCAQIMMQQGRQRKLENLESTLALTRLEIESDKNFVLSDHPINPDFQDFWQDMAEKANHEYARLLWAKVLKGELQRPDSFSLRTLGILRQLAQEEAELFVKFARYAVKGCILDKEPALFPQKEVIILNDAGLIMSWQQHNIEVSTGNALHIPISYIELDDYGVSLYWHNKPKNLVFHGYALTQSGKALLSIADVEPMSEQIVKRIFDVLKYRNKELKGIAVKSLKEKSDNYKYFPL